MGNSLARGIPASCSVAIVKDYKVLFYKEKASNSSYMVSEGEAYNIFIVISIKKD